MATIVVWGLTSMNATVAIEVAVVRAAKAQKCEACDHRRVVYALTLTRDLLGNPEHPWKCAPCWGLR